MQPCVTRARCWLLAGSRSAALPAGERRACAGAVRYGPAGLPTLTLKVLPSQPRAAALSRRAARHVRARGVLGARAAGWTCAAAWEPHACMCNSNTQSSATQLASRRKTRRLRGPRLPGATHRWRRAAPPARCCGTTRSPRAGAQVGRNVAMRLNPSSLKAWRCFPAYLLLRQLVVQKSKSVSAAPSENRARVACATNRSTNHYTNEAVGVFATCFGC